MFKKPVDSKSIEPAVRLSLAEDIEDLSAFEDRANEPTVPYEELWQELQSAGRL